MSQPGHTSPLGAALNQAEQATELGRAVAEGGAIVHRPFTFPIGEASLAIVMRVLGPDEELEAVAEFSERIRATKIAPDWLAVDVVEGERARCYLSRACRSPADPARPAGTAAQWRHPAITAPIVRWLWVEYADMVASYDPFGGELLEADVADIAAALKKKALGSLASFGAWKLARYLLTSADQPAASPTPPSSAGGGDANTPPS